jgi:hypothetical protein
MEPTWPVAVNGTIKESGNNFFKVIKKTGTSGIIYVGGLPVQTYPYGTAPTYHILNKSDYLYTYSDGYIPIKRTTCIDRYSNANIYIYMANGSEYWGSLSNKLFATLNSPTEGYLSRNWPGNTARWIATVNLTSPVFSGSYMRANVLGSTAVDDFSSTVITTYSSLKIDALNTAMNTALLYAIANIINDSVIATNSTWSSSMIAAYLSVADHV